MLKSFTYEDEPEGRSSEALIQALDKLAIYEEYLQKIKRETSDGVAYKYACEALQGLNIKKT